MALAPQGADSDALQQMGRSATRSMQAVSRPRSGASLARATRTGGSAALARSGDSADPIPARPARTGAGKAALTAAERARIKRSSGGAIAGLKIFWIEASQKTRRLIYGAAGVIGLGLVGLLYWLVLASGVDNDLTGKPDPVVLTRAPIPESFGLGDGVDHPREDQKSFEFELISPVRALAILQFQARDIAAGEVVVTCNAQEVGQVPADTLDTADRMLEIVIPASVLKKGERNQIIFDNVRNPPGKDPWRIWNVSIEPVMLSEESVDKLQVDAKNAFDRGIRNMERKDVGAENRYNAWKEFREAWLLLESHPDPKPALYDLARAKVKEAQQELDRTCARLMLEVERYYNQQNWDAARSTLDHVKAFFPTANDQRCPQKAERKRHEYDL